MRYRRPCPGVFLSGRFPERERADGRWRFGDIHFNLQEEDIMNAGLVALLIVAIPLITALVLALYYEGES